jgi:hypothetical protein
MVRNFILKCGMRNDLSRVVVLKRYQCYLSFADDNLLVGTRQGHLLMYSVACRFGDQKHEVQLLRYNKNFSKKPIQQLAVVPEYQLLISLSGNNS